ncbi:MAG TPA: glycosyltransferase [Candidatus Paceibacterota bacterium]|nr:glycosyltransferase [Candidatus Paceibacterota bacterium]
MKKALLSYSRAHFDPLAGEQKFHSASIIAKSLYDTLKRTGYEVDYIDASESPAGSRYDLFVGIPLRWVEIAAQCDGAIKVLFMPTGHPLYRNERMRAARKIWNAPYEEELLDAGPAALQAFTLADYILQIGNEMSVIALIERGVPRKKILLIHYGLPASWSASAPSASGPLDRYIHVAAGLGLRKGLPAVLQAFSVPPFNAKALTLVGEIKKEANHAYWQARLDELVRKNPRVTRTGFIDSSSQKYKEALAQNAWYLFPSIEDVEPGTLQEAMTIGLVPLLASRESGVDFVLDDDFSATFEQSLTKTLTVSKESWKTLSEKAKHYISLFHDHSLWEERLVEVFSKIAAGERDLHPSASIILTVHDKEKHIVRLLQTLLINTRSYPRWDLHIVYDGCNDASRQVAQETLKNFPVSVYEYETPDVWEVKANNYGLKQAQGKYCIILQDDNFIYEEAWLEKMLSWLEEHPKVGILGGLAGVNFFHLDSDPQGPGVNRSAFELHQRLDPAIQTELQDYVFEADAVMRGPIILRKALLEKHGYFDEAYAPLYNDDMDYCFRMRSLGYGVFCYPINVVNESLTVAQYKNPAKDKFWKDTAEKNQKLFYGRWSADIEKYHATCLKVPRPAFTASFGALQKAKPVAHLPHFTLYDVRIRSRATARALFLRLPAPLVRVAIRGFQHVGARSVAEKLRIHYFEGKTIPWRLANGDATLRVDYPLGSSSVVYSIGKKNAEWAAAMQDKYRCKVQTLSSWPGAAELAADLEAQLRAREAPIDLMSLNMDGGEYELMAHLLETGMVNRIKNIQVSFDERVPDALGRMRAIRKRLRETHAPTYQYDFVWENWEAK